MTNFELILFSIDPEFVRKAVAAGVAAAIVDWEHEHKEARQREVDTEINRHTAQDLQRVRAATHARVLCRLNAFSKRSGPEVEAAIASGADEILLPLVRTVEEVEAVLSLVDGRRDLGILIETEAALAVAPALGRLPLSRAYLGLNDLAIERRSPTIFAPLVDGTLDALRPHFTMPFGFGGLTLPDRGSPVPCRLLIAELARLRCSFSFLRRSFHRDILGRDVTQEIARLRAALDAAFARSPNAVRRERSELEWAVHALAPSAPTSREAKGAG